MKTALGHSYLLLVIAILSIVIITSILIVIIAIILIVEIAILLIVEDGLGKLPGVVHAEALHVDEQAHELLYICMYIYI